MGKLFTFSRHLQKWFGELLPKDTAYFVFHYARLDVFFEYAVALLVCQKIIQKMWE